MRLLGDLVGQTGSVTGIDLDGALGREALDHLRALGTSTYAFHERDATAPELPPGGPFDVVYTRLVLIHLDDPVGALRQLYAWLKPGGVLIMQDYDMSVITIHPPLATWPVAWAGVIETFERAGRDPWIGARLPSLFVDAGLGVPEGTDGSAALRPLRDLAALFEAAVVNLLPISSKLGLVTEDDAKAYSAELHEAAKDDRYSAMAPLLLSAWKRKPA